MDIIFLGGVFEKNKIDEIVKKSKSGIQFAADTLQWNIINGLDYWNGKPTSIINAPFIGSYPKYYRDAYSKRSDWSHVPNANDLNIGFLNIWGIKNIFRAVALAGELTKRAGKNKTDQVIIAYSINMPFLWALSRCKKINSAIRTCLIVPDLPAHMNLTSKVGWIYKTAKKIENILTGRLMKYVDSLVLLTQSMTEVIDVADKKFCIVEGMVNEKDIGINDKKKPEKHQVKSILYTGTLNYKYGIGRLLEAFKLINDSSYELWVCGYGEAEDHIKKLAAEDQRIKWFGTVTREQAIYLQRKATVLINPRPPGEEFTKYSFPSKNLEYLTSGRPVIAYKLPGIPAEYDDYMFYIEGDHIQHMTEKITEICEWSEEERNHFGEKAKEFVRNNKNNLVQTKKIIDMVFLLFQ